MITLQKMRVIVRIIIFEGAWYSTWLPKAVVPYNIFLCNVKPVPFEEGSSPCELGRHRRRRCRRRRRRRRRRHHLSYSESLVDTSVVHACVRTGFHKQCNCDQPQLFNSVDFNHSINKNHPTWQFRQLSSLNVHHCVRQITPCHLSQIPHC